MQAEAIADVREKLLDWVSAAIEAGLPQTRARMIRLEARHGILRSVAATLLEFLFGEVVVSDIGFVEDRLPFAGTVAKLDAKPEGIAELALAFFDVRRQEQQQRADILPGMPRQMIGIVAAHEAGRGLLAGIAAEDFCIEPVGLGLVDAVLRVNEGA